MRVLIDSRAVKLIVIVVLALATAIFNGNNPHARTATTVGSLLIGGTIGLALAIGEKLAYHKISAGLDELMKGDTPRVTVRTKEGEIVHVNGVTLLDAILEMARKE